MSRKSAQIRERTAAGLSHCSEDQWTLPVFTLVKEGGLMNQGKLSSAMAMTNLRLNPPHAEATPAEPKARSRHAAITHDLYSYRRYKHWMNSLRDSWDRT